MNTTAQASKMKHPQFILAADQSFFNTDLIEELFGKPLENADKGGITALNGEVFYDVIAGYTVLRRRHELDQTDTVLPYRQFLPYDVFTRLNRNFKRTYFAYRRKPSSGESELHGKVSIGIGGHIDGHSVFFDHLGALLVQNSVINSSMKEKVEELVIVKDGVKIEKIEDQVELHGAWIKPNLHVNLLVDNSDNVGKRHFALVTLNTIPEDYELEIAEEELETLGFLTAEELRATENGKPKYELESWTKICLDYFERAATGKVGVQADMTEITRGLLAQKTQDAAMDALEHAGEPAFEVTETKVENIGRGQTHPAMTFVPEVEAKTNAEVAAQPETIEVRDEPAPNDTDPAYKRVIAGREVDPSAPKVVYDFSGDVPADPVIEVDVTVRVINSPATGEAAPATISEAQLQTGLGDAHIPEDGTKIAGGQALVMEEELQDAATKLSGNVNSIENWEAVDRAATAMASGAGLLPGQVNVPSAVKTEVQGAVDVIIGHSHPEQSADHMPISAALVLQEVPDSERKIPDTWPPLVTDVPNAVLETPADKPTGLPVLNDPTKR